MGIHGQAGVVHHVLHRRLYRRGKDSGPYGRQAGVHGRAEHVEPVLHVSGQRLHGIRGPGIRVAGAVPAPPVHVFHVGRAQDEIRFRRDAQSVDPEGEMIQVRPPASQLRPEPPDDLLHVVSRTRLFHGRHGRRLADFRRLSEPFDLVTGLYHAKQPDEVRAVQQPGIGERPAQLCEPARGHPVRLHAQGPSGKSPVAQGPGERLGGRAATRRILHEGVHPVHPVGQRRRRQGPVESGIAAYPEVPDPEIHAVDGQHRAGHRQRGFSFQGKQRVSLRQVRRSAGPDHVLFHEPVDPDEVVGEIGDIHGRRRDQRVETAVPHVFPGPVDVEEHLEIDSGKCEISAQGSRSEARYGAAEEVR